MSDRVKSGLRGPVRSCLTEHTMYVRQCGAEACLTEETVHDELGLPVELAFSDSQGRVLRRVSFRYDEAGRLMEEADENRGLEAHRSPFHLYLRRAGQLGRAGGSRPEPAGRG